MGLKVRLMVVLFAVATLGASGCFFPPINAGNELAAWDLRTCNLSGTGACGAYSEFVFNTDGSFRGLAGTPVTGTWTDRGNGRITMTWQTALPGAGLSSADFQLSGGNTLDTATTLNGTQTLIFFGIAEQYPLEGIRMRP